MIRSDKINWPILNERLKSMLVVRGIKDIEGYRVPIKRGAKKLRVLVVHSSSDQVVEFSPKELKFAGVLAA